MAATGRTVNGHRSTLLELAPSLSGPRPTRSRESTVGNRPRWNCWSAGCARAATRGGILPECDSSPLVRTRCAAASGADPLDAETFSLLHAGQLCRPLHLPSCRRCARDGIRAGPDAVTFTTPLPPRSPVRVTSRLGARSLSLRAAPRPHVSFSARPSTSARAPAGRPGRAQVLRGWDGLELYTDSRAELPSLPGTRAGDLRRNSAEEFDLRVIDASHDIRPASTRSCAGITGEILPGTIADSGRTTMQFSRCTQNDWDGHGLPISLRSRCPGH